MERNYLQKIGANIKKERLAKNLKQEYIATKTNLHKSEISRIENGQINIGVITLIEISKAIGIPVMLFFDDATLL